MYILWLQRYDSMSHLTSQSCFRTFTPSQPFYASTEGGHSQGDWRPLCLFYLPN